MKRTLDRLVAAWRTRSREPRHVRRRWLLGGGSLMLVALIATPFVWWNFFGPERFESLALGVVPSPRAAAVEDAAPITTTPLDLGPDVRVHLLFSSGSTGVSQADAERLRINDLDARRGDRLTDTLMLLIMDPSTREAALVSIPRDLWIFDRGHRINESFARHGAQALIDDVSAVTGLPVHHLIQVNFSAFADLVDAIGGIAVSVERPLADLEAVLYVPAPGCWAFDGAAALAYARSRHTLTWRGDEWRTDNSASDFGRMDRQRALLGAAWEQVRGPSIITRIPDLMGLASGLRIDDELGVGDIIDLARTFSDVAAGRVESYTLPTKGRRIKGAAAQVLDVDAATPILGRLRSWPPSPTPVAVPSPGDPDRAPTPSTDDVATRRTMPTPPADCTRANARPLPDPRLALVGVLEGRPPEDPGPADDGPTEDPPTESPAPTPSDEPTPDGSDPGPGPGPQPVPEPEPVPQPSPEPVPPIVPPTLPGTAPRSAQ